MSSPTTKPKRKARKEKLMMMASSSTSSPQVTRPVKPMLDKPLLTAAFTGDLSSVCELIEQGANKNATNANVREEDGLFESYRAL
jgi:hypothetical protein